MGARITGKLAKEMAQKHGLDGAKRRPRAEVGERREMVLARRALFLAACRAHGLPQPEPEYLFCEGREWRFDYCWPRAKHPLALEIQGGLFTGGRHTRGARLLGEYEKLNEAQRLGYRVLLVIPQQVESGEVFALVRRHLEV